MQHNVIIMYEKSEEKKLKEPEAVDRNSWYVCEQISKFQIWAEAS